MDGRKHRHVRALLPRGHGQVRRGAAGLLLPALCLRRGEAAPPPREPPPRPLITLSNSAQSRAAWCRRSTRAPTPSPRPRARPSGPRPSSQVARLARASSRPRAAVRQDAVRQDTGAPNCRPTAVQACPSASTSRRLGSLRTRVRPTARCPGRPSSAWASIPPPPPPPPPRTGVAQVRAPRFRAEARHPRTAWPRHSLMLHLSPHLPHPIPWPPSRRAGRQQHHRQALQHAARGRAGHLGRLPRLPRALCRRRCARRRRWLLQPFFTPPSSSCLTTFAAALAARASSHRAHGRGGVPVPAELPAFPGLA